MQLLLHVLCFVVVVLVVVVCVCVCVAYREGVVVTTCKGCDSKHLIADNLSTDNGSLGGGTNIEDYFKINGGSNTNNNCDHNNGNDDNTNQEVVLRVNQDVFQLEKLLHFDTSGGAIPGGDDDDEKMLE